MTDSVTNEQRSWNMSRIRSGNTTPELVVRSLLHRMGYRFSLRRKDLPGKPDIVLRKYRTVIFVHGCFWHRHPGCKQATTPKSRREFWQAKFDRNVARDRKNQEELRDLGWKVIVLWECEVKADPVKVVTATAETLNPNQSGKIRYDDLPSRKTCLEIAEKKLRYNLKKESSSE